MKTKIKWGIIGLGKIAHQFATALQLVENAQLAAVASRNLDKATAFATEFDCPKAYGTYDDLMQDDEITIIYIATPHNSHAEFAIKAMQHNKHVLCEKPIAMRHLDALLMVETSRKYGVFFMEAFWTRFNPAVREAFHKIEKGEIGTIKYINADFAFAVENLENNRMTDLQLGGGALLDIGVYPLFLAYLILGIPKEITAKAHFHPTGADVQTTIILDYEQAQAVLHCSFLSTSNLKATISGSEGRINLNSPWFMTQSYTVVKDNQKTKFKWPTKGKGYAYEIEECHTCIAQNRIESTLWSHQNSLELMAIVDAVRNQIGLVFPSDKKEYPL
ncbi:Gfo/Idh/MocA family protein [Flavobacterium restrictum]|uniref:Gfo/Idh/MocA family oxidoreductase n=1 Tax=Flavobacterium restrictum TaxID=2594428 RepID=A0A553E8Y0_9FLAO|nr:Gfo/Idh/MocA family oxidoreductase [Flavobacterium restrictum]TRX41486.1 Gfo/Idh/MocA family oxidoreductase [Flavobacterium restrictum]